MQGIGSDLSNGLTVTGADEINGPVHPLYRRLLERFCAETGLDARGLEEMATGVRPAPSTVVDMLAVTLDVPRSSWPKRAALRRSGMLVTSASAGNYGGVIQAGTNPDRANKAPRRPKGGPRKRRYRTRVHDVVEALGWNVQTLTEKLAAELPNRSISRPSIQNWSTGTRQVGPKGASKPHPVQAPLDVREAAERLTAREAKRKGLPESAILRARDWPNVEDA